MSAVSAEIVGGALPEKRFWWRYLRRNTILILTPDSAGRLHGRGGAYSKASLVSAVMLARIGPTKPFLFKALIAHSEACGHTELAAHAQPHARKAKRPLRIRRSPAARRGRTCT